MTSSYNRRHFGYQKGHKTWESRSHSSPYGSDIPSPQALPPSTGNGRGAHILFVKRGRSRCPNIRITCPKGCVRRTPCDRATGAQQVQDARRGDAPRRVQRRDASVDTRRRSISPSGVAHTNSVHSWPRPKSWPEVHPTRKLTYIVHNRKLNSSRKFYNKSKTRDIFCY